MKVIIAGSRGIEDSLGKVVSAALEADFPITQVVSGTCWGIDKAGEEYAKILNVPVKQFPANWERHGKAAGYLRNKQMAEYADALIAVWDGKSRGTKHMIDLAEKNNLKIYVKNLGAL